MIQTLAKPLLTGEWLKISPYGDFPNKVGLQRFQRTDAETIVKAFNSLPGRASQPFMGLPIYVGHPDVEPAAYTDKRRYGKIIALEARNDGLYGKVVLNDLGKEAIDEGHFTFNSPAWNLKRDAGFIRPIELISVGLTNTPNILGDPWAKNESENQMTTTQKIQAEVKRQAELHKLNLATNDGYNLAFSQARRHNPSLFATNDGLANATTSQDGQMLNGDWPVPPGKLVALGLPTSATREQYQLFKLAAETKLTPEMAAVIVRTLIQFSQLSGALSFDDAMEHLKKHRPEIYKLALEAEQTK